MLSTHGVGDAEAKQAVLVELTQICLMILPRMSAAIQESSTSFMLVALASAPDEVVKLKRPDSLMIFVRYVIASRGMMA